MNPIVALLESKGRLGVAEVRRLYRAMSLRAHPDRPGGDVEVFKALAEDYEEALAIARRAELERAGAGARSRGVEARREAGRGKAGARAFESVADALSAFSRELDEPGGTDRREEALRYVAAAEPALGVRLAALDPGPDVRRRVGRERAAIRHLAAAMRQYEYARACGISYYLRIFASFAEDARRAASGLDEAFRDGVEAALERAEEELAAER